MTEIRGNSGTRPDAGADETVEAIIIGNGFSGIAMAIRLRAEGLDDFVILDRAEDIGGTWRDNTYPGCACDVPSHLYSYSFAPNPGWSRAFSGWAEIGAYLRHVFEEHGLRPHLRPGHGVATLDWEADTGTWLVCCHNGRRLRARFVINGSGALSQPVIPDLPGLADFAGVHFHSAEWRHDVTLDGKRIAVIGTGASAIQFVPQIVSDAARLSLFQRTPPWIMPKPDRAYRSWQRRACRRIPGWQKLHRWGLYWAYELRVLGFVVHPWIMRVAERVARRHMRRQLRYRPDLWAALTPDYTMGCKRILMANDYYPSLALPQVELVTAGIERITPNGIRTRDGIEHDADVIIWGTGFAATDYMKPMRVRGVDGRDLHHTFQVEGRGSYLGIHMHGFPNLFLLTGPNTGLGHSSMVYMIESAVGHIGRMLRRARREPRTVVEVRAEAQARWDARLQERLKRTVWMSGCQSWYLSANGRNDTLWPGFTFGYRSAVRRPDWQALELRSAAAAPEVA